MHVINGDARSKYYYKLSSNEVTYCGAATMLLILLENYKLIDGNNLELKSLSIIDNILKAGYEIIFDTNYFDRIAIVKFERTNEGILDSIEVVHYASAFRINEYNESASEPEKCLFRHTIKEISLMYGVLLENGVKLKYKNIEDYDKANVMGLLSSLYKDMLDRNK